MVFEVTTVSGVKRITGRRVSYYHMRRRRRVLSSRFARVLQVVVHADGLRAARTINIF